MIEILVALSSTCMMKKHLSNIGIFILLFFIISCNRHSELQEALSLSGDNRSELESVLKHYEGNPPKRAAAEFLLGNMFHYSLVDGGMVYDIRSIKSDYLIRNIESAFAAWEEAPWKEEVDFDTFCRFVLPYRVCDEPLSVWRDSLKNAYKDLVKGEKHAVDAYAKVYSALLKRFKKLGDGNLSSPDVMELHRSQRGTCSQRSIYVVSVLRSLGIPAAYDCVPFWGNYSTSGHAWVSFVNGNRTFTVYDKDTVAHEYNAIDGSGFNDGGSLVHPYLEWDSVKRPPVINRRCYELQQPLLARLDKDTPPALKESFSVNVSAQYGFRHHVEIPSPDAGKACLYAFETGKGWRAVTGGEEVDGKTKFTQVPGNMVYLPVCYHDGVEEAAGYPFLMDADGNRHVYAPDLEHTRSVTLWRKFPLRKQWYNRWKMILGSTIEVSDHPSFRPSRTVHTFRTPPETILGIALSLDRPYRYIRIRTNPAERPEVAEFKVFAKGGKKRLYGKPVYCLVPDSTVHKIFDDDYLTYAEKAVHGYWVGLDLGEDLTDKPDSVEFCMRHDMNMIKRGDEYELFYYDREWKSLGRQVADADSLVYHNVPDNALLWLKNHTEGKEERIFTYENGKQRFW